MQARVNGEAPIVRSLRRTSMETISFTDRCSPWRPSHGVTWSYGILSVCQRL